MKKITALILSCIMALMCASTVLASDFQSISGSFKENGQTLLGGSVQLGSDDDGCVIIYLNNDIDGSQTIVQIGNESIVYGTADNLTEISYSDLADMIEVQISADDAQISDIMEYIGSEDLQNDLQSISDALTAEYTKILLLANQEGLVTTAEDGTITIEFDTESLIHYISLVISDLSQNDEILEALTSTKLWQMLNIEGGKEAIQQFLAQTAEETSVLQPEDLGMKLKCKCVITPAGDITYSFEEVSDEITQKIDLTSSGDDMEFAYAQIQDDASLNVKLSVKDEIAAFSGTLGQGEEAEAVTFEGTLDCNTADLQGKVTQQGETIDIVGTLDNTQTDETKYVITGVFEDTVVFNVLLGAKSVSDAEGTESYKIYANVNDTEYALYLSSSTNDDESQYILKITQTYDGETTDLYNIDISASIINIDAQHLTGSKAVQ